MVFAQPSPAPALGPVWEAWAAGDRKGALVAVPDDLVDALVLHGTPAQVRKQVEDFNARVMKARYTPVDGPPLITMPRDVDETVAAWREGSSR